MSDAMADTLPLQRLVETLITLLFLPRSRRISEGRLLLFGTTDLEHSVGYLEHDRSRASNDPDALGLFRKILLESASIPAPSLRDDNVTVDGKRYQEMHVDGGANRPQVFHLSAAVPFEGNAAAKGFDRKRTLYIIRNARSSRIGPTQSANAPSPLRLLLANPHTGCDLNRMLFDGCGATV